jgi:glycosyltransferase involved in cell wall biosynthesis
VYRRTRYVTVSDATHRELVGLGVPASRISIIHNGTDAVAGDGVVRSVSPRVVVLGRLVPQKRVEIAVSAVAALRPRLPGLHLDIVGAGWWEPQLRAHVEHLGLADAVTFHGHVSEAEKHRLLARAWVHAMPSLKEGWGLVVVEAGVHGTPTLAFRDAGGPADSVRDGVTGILVDGPADDLSSAPFTRALDTLLTDPRRRADMAAAAQAWVSRFRWEDAVLAWEELLEQEAGRRDR